MWLVSVSLWTCSLSSRCRNRVACVLRRKSSAFELDCGWHAIRARPYADLKADCGFFRGSWFTKRRWSSEKTEHAIFVDLRGLRNYRCARMSGLLWRKKHYHLSSELLPLLYRDAQLASSTIWRMGPEPPGSIARSSLSNPRAQHHFVSGTHRGDANAKYVGLRRRSKSIEGKS